MIKKILCKLGLHKYEMSHFILTSSIATRVKCKWCGHNLRSDAEKRWEKKRKKILKHNYLP